MRFRIFISSVQDEFREERRELKQWILQNPLLSRYVESVFLFEDSPARGDGSQEVFLEEVARSQIYIGILGRCYCGRDHGDCEVSPTELEYDKAGECGLERFVYLLDCAERDERQSAFVRKVNADVKRRRFADLDSLRSEVFASLIAYLDRLQLLEANDWDKSASEAATVADVSEERVRWYIGKVNALNEEGIPLETSIADFLDAYRLRGSDGRLTNAALLLFGKDPQKYYYPATLKCVWCKGAEYDPPFLDTKGYHGNLFDLIDLGVKFVVDRMARSRGLREELETAPMKFDVPIDAVREALTNALVHRNYRLYGSVEVRLYADRLEIWNPGQLPTGITIEELFRLHSSYPVNFRLVEFCDKCGIIESLGSGVRRMVNSCRKANVPNPVFEQAGPSFRVTFWFDQWTDSRLAQLKLNERQRMAVRFLKENALITAAQYAEMGTVVKRTAIRDLRELVEKEVIETVGVGKSISYALKHLRDICATCATQSRQNCAIENSTVPKVAKLPVNHAIAGDKCDVVNGHQDAIDQNNSTVNSTVEAENSTVKGRDSTERAVDLTSLPKALKRLCVIMGREELSSKELCQRLSLRSRGALMQTYIHPAIKAGIIEVFGGETHSSKRTYRLIQGGGRWK